MATAVGEADQLCVLFANRTRSPAPRLLVLPIIVLRPIIVVTPYFLKQKLQSSSQAAPPASLRYHLFLGLFCFCAWAGLYNVPDLLLCHLLATPLHGLPLQRLSLFLSELIVVCNCDLPQDAALLY